jgi:hypothetical protein
MLVTLAGIVTLALKQASECSKVAGRTFFTTYLSIMILPRSFFALAALKMCL